MTFYLFGGTVFYLTAWSGDRFEGNRPIAGLVVAALWPLVLGAVVLDKIRDMRYQSERPQ